jgi:hypothetical protein
MGGAAGGAAVGKTGVSGLTAIRAPAAKSEVMHFFDFCRLFT